MLAFYWIWDLCGLFEKGGSVLILGECSDGRLYDSH